MYKGQAIVNLAEKQIGTRGAEAKKYCGLPSNANYCDGFVTWLFYKEDVADLFCNGKKQVYCPDTIVLIRRQMPMLPIYLGLPGDVIFLDWEPNGTPNHIAIVRKRVSDLEIDTVEGNTSMQNDKGQTIATGVVANKTRPYFIPGTNKVQIAGMFRPQFHVDKSEFDASNKLIIDGLFGFNSIACLQKALKAMGLYTGEIDAIMGLGTVKGLQKVAGVEADGSWGPKTTKAVQRMIGTKADGFFGPKSVKALQEWINKQNSLTWQQKATKWARETAESGKYSYVKWVKGDKDTHECPICHPRKRKIGGNCIWWAFACWHHGGGLKTKCSCDVLTNQMYDKMFDMTEKKASELASERIGKEVEVIMNRGKAIPQDWIKEADIGVLFKGKNYYHTIYCEGDGKYSDCTSGRTPSIKADMKMSRNTRANLKMIIRYVGK